MFARIGQIGEQLAGQAAALRADDVALAQTVPPRDREKSRLHHWPDTAAGLREVRRVLRPAGRAWIYDARFSLGRANRAAREVIAGYAVQRETLRLSRLPIHPFGRLTLQQ